MSERKTRQPKANAKRPAAGTASPGARKVAKPGAAARNGGPRRAKPGARPGRPNANAHTPAAPPPKRKARRPKRPKRPKAPQTQAQTRARPTRRIRPPKATGRTMARFTKLAKAVIARARAAWIELSPRAKAGAAATATVTARLARRSGSGLLEGFAASLRFANKHRRTALQICHRFAWWGSWAIMLIAGRNLVAFEQSGSLPAEQATFLWGLGLCAFVVATAAERRMRTGALALGGAHALAAAIIIAG